MNHMAKCNKCGTTVNDEVKFCPSCGNKIEQGQNNYNGNDINQKLQDLNNTNDYTANFDRNDIEQNKVLALFSYLGILFIIPLIAAPNSPYAKFHANQGLVLFICEIAISIATGIISAIIWFVGSLLGSLLGLVVFVLAIVGIVNAVTGKAKELPIIGGIKIIK